MEFTLEAFTRSSSFSSWKLGNVLTDSLDFDGWVGWEEAEGGREGGRDGEREKGILTLSWELKSPSEMEWKETRTSEKVENDIE